MSEDEESGRRSGGLPYMVETTESRIQKADSLNKVTMNTVWPSEFDTAILLAHTLASWQGQR